MANYFTVETDESIEAFQAAESDNEKHRIFNEEIRPAFEKLIENLIFVYKFFKFGDIEIDDYNSHPVIQLPVAV